MSDQTIVAAVDEGLRAELAALRKEGWSNGRIAAAIGYSGSVISQYLADEGNKYAGDVDGLQGRIREFLRDRRISQDTGVTSLACEVSRQIEDAIEDARTGRKRVAIIGLPGIGKSRGVSLYVAKHSLAIAMLANSWSYDKWHAARILLKAADVTHTKHGLAEIAVLADKMHGSTRTIIVDDAHKLTRDALQLFYDFTDSTGMPMALLGTPELEAKLKDNGQRLRRTGNVYRLRVTSPDDLIQHHLEEMIPDGGGEEAEELHALCRKIVGKEVTHGSPPRKTFTVHPGAFGNLQMELALALRLKRKDWSWCEAVQRAHRKLIRDYQLD
jgi:DNA transposition AAA+ family ATPase